MTDNIDDYEIACGISHSRARLAIWATCRDPGYVYNPLFVYGGDSSKKHGLKLSLLQHMRSNLDLAVVTLGVDKYCTQYLSALKKEEGQQFRDEFVSADAFVVDDMQLLGNFHKTQQIQFQRTIESMYVVYKQIVIFSEVPVKKIRGLANLNLISRFARNLEIEI